MFTTDGVAAELLMPTIDPPVPDVVAVIAPVPVAAPMMLGVMFPAFTLPPVMLIPHSMPLVVVVVLLVDMLIAVIVFPCTDDAVVVPTFINMP